MGIVSVTRRFVGKAALCCALLLGNAVIGVPARGSGVAPIPALVDPTTRALVAQLFAEALLSPAALPRDLLPGQADNHLAYFPQQYLLPLSSSAPSGSPLLGYPIGTNGTVLAMGVTLGVTQGTGTDGVTLTGGGGACYMAAGTTNDLAGYSVDVATSHFSVAPGSPFPTGSAPVGVVADPSGRFVYALNRGNSTLTAYGINPSNQALAPIATTLTAANPSAITATRQCVFVANIGSGGYEAFAINPATGVLSSVPGSPFGSEQASSIAHTPNGNYVYFSSSSSPTQIDGFFVDANCALTPVPGSPFTGPAGAVLRTNADLPALYAAGSGTLQGFAIDAPSGRLTTLGSLAIDPATNAMVVGPKGLFLWIADGANQNVRSVALNRVTGAPMTVGAAVSGPPNVAAMTLVNENATQLIGLGVPQTRSQRTLGGAPPYTYALTGGSLPAGLHFDASTGEITGTPGALGQTTFVLTVTDGVGATSVSNRTWQVVTPPAFPAAPSNVTATAVGRNEVLVSWQDNANQTAGFQIQMSQDGGPFVAVEATKPSVQSTYVSNLSPATSYAFRVRAINAAGGATSATTATAVTQNADPIGCSGGANGQCLLGGRFLLQGFYQDNLGDIGLAHVVPITSDTAYLWFFSPSNVEVVLKVLDGCPLDGHFWVFAGGLTNVHVLLRLIDTQTGATRFYETPNGPGFLPIQDVAAFGSCPAASGPRAEEAVAAVDSGPRALGGAVAAAPPGGTAPTCAASATAMCLNNNRFKVEATFDAGPSGSGSARAVPLTADTGYLWFFAPTNVEVVLKVLDACGFNQRFWVYAGGLTNVQVTVTVTDTLTGQIRQYTNAAGSAFEPIQDSSAFATCP